VPVATIAPVELPSLLCITAEPLDPADALAFVHHPEAGGVVLFEGTVRDHSAAGDVTSLEYEAWEEVARERLAEIAGEMHDRWDLRRSALLHRTGLLSVGTVSVIVCASAPHRADAFEAARHGIERIKEDVPIWKRESLTSGEAHWVMGS